MAKNIRLPLTLATFFFLFLTLSFGKLAKCGREDSGQGLAARPRGPREMTEADLFSHYFSPDCLSLSSRLAIVCVGVVVHSLFLSSVLSLRRGMESILLCSNGQVRLELCLRTKKVMRGTKKIHSGRSRREREAKV